MPTRTSSLHVCKLGPFNHLIKSLGKLCPEVVDTFVDKVGVVKEKYHGGDFEGNEIDKLLKNISVLEEIIDDQYADFISAFKSIQKVNEQVGGKTLKADFKNAIDDFTINFLNLNVNHAVSTPPKAHIIMEHVKTFCEQRGKSLRACMH